MVEHLVELRARWNNQMKVTYSAILKSLITHLDLFACECIKPISKFSTRFVAWASTTS